MGVWTATPRTWVAGEVPTAANFNSDVRDFGRAFSDAWTSYTPTLTASGSNPTNWTQTGYYMQAGKLVVAKFVLTAGASMTAGSGNYRVALPVNAATGVTVELGTIRLFDNSSAASHLAFASIGGAGAANLEILYAPTVGTVGLVTNAAPWTWAASDLIRGQIVYEAA